MIDDEPFAAQSRHDRRGQLGLVFHQQDAHAGPSFSAFSLLNMADAKLTGELPDP
jgi:hypothetical protein